jgi:2-polyprenyl-6-methoxyphenol hydroxylase-like FAD-dependent oxidoreductase
MMMSNSDPPIIAGAGPVGLGAALFLARQGRSTRLVELLDEPTTQSKALAVNPRTLSILEPTDITRQMLELGSPIHGVQFHRSDRVIAAVSLAGIHPKYPFMLALSQVTTERLLARALEAAGGVVERGVRMVECRNLTDGVEVVLVAAAGGVREVVKGPWLLAADGAHSVVRHHLGIDFAGSSFSRDWHLADTPLRTALDADHAHVFFLGKGRFLFMIRVVDDIEKGGTEDSVWRIMGNFPEPLSRLVQAEQAGPPLWTSSFHISHRINATLSVGSIYFAGDAAHVHSPMGARGMNLGLEDAFVFAELVRTGRLDEYDRLRRPIDGEVVRRVEFLSQVVSAESWFNWLVRSFVLPRAVRIPFIRSRMVGTVTGLDHELPLGLAGVTS